MQEKLKQLMYENEKLYQDCSKLKKTQIDSAALNEEGYRKKIKRLTGEVDMFEAYQSSMHQLFLTMPKVKSSAKSELAKIQQSFKESIDFMREVCNDTGVNVTQGKQVQRQVRYEKLK